MLTGFVSLDIEDDYDGPKLHDGKHVTLTFMNELMELYRNQGKLHRKFAYQVYKSLSRKYAAFALLMCFRFYSIFENI